MRAFVRKTAWVLIVAVAVFTVSPIGFRPMTSFPPDVERFVGILAMMGALCVGYPRHRLHLLCLAILGILLLESMQNLMPGRHGTVHDVLVKGVAAGLGTVGSILLEGIAAQAVRNWAFRRLATSI